MELLLIVIFVGAVIFLRYRLDPDQSKSKGKTKDLSNYRYYRKDYFMSAAERKMFDLLLAAVGDQYYVFPQVHLSTLLNHKVKGQNWKGAFSHINGKSVDFVICDKQKMTPLVAIELDDSTHRRPDRSQRDAVVEEIFTKANFPLVRFANLDGLTSENVSQRLDEVLGTR